MPKKPATQEQLLLERKELRARLDDAEETLRTIRSGGVDALIVPGVDGEQIFTLKGANYSYRMLIEDMNEGALTLTGEGVILYANRRFAEMLKTPLEKVIGSTIHTWIAPDSQPILQSLLRKGENEKHHEQLVLAAGDGTPVPISLSVCNLIRNEMPDCFGLVATDLTEQKRSDAIAASEKLAQGLLAASNQSRLALLSVIEDQKQAEEEVKKYLAELVEKNEELRAMTRQLWQVAKLATMGELAASIAHELNNPLATVSLRVESLLEKTPEDNSNRRELNVIEQEVERMSNLIANLLQFSRRGQQEISTVDVSEEIEKTLELVYYHLRQNNIIIEREFEKEIPHIHADRQQLRQLFLNLFTNASDAMPLGGTLTIRVTAPPQVRHIIIDIADTGTGIPPEILPNVWEAFYTTKPEGKGTGLGLAICRRIVLEHGGTFDLTSEGVPGRGTTVHISLPVRNGKNEAELK